jgi:hypothetical protein
VALEQGEIGDELVQINEAISGEEARPPRQTSMSARYCSKTLVSTNLKWLAGRIPGMASMAGNEFYWQRQIVDGQIRLQDRH